MASNTSNTEEEVRRTPRRSFRNRERGWFMQTPPHARPRGVGEAAGDGAATPRPGSLRYVVAAIVAVILIVIALGHMLGVGSSPQAAPTATAPPAPTTPPNQFNPASGPPAQVVRVLGQAAGLSGPREAVPLPGGQFLVADTGHSRLAVLDASGRLVRSDHGGATPLQEPYALAATASHLYVLDAKNEAIEQYSPSGHFQKELVHDPALQDGRGLAAGPNGDLYVANPLLNSIVVVSPNGAITQKLSSSLGAGSGQFNQPSDVAAGPDGTLYVLDNQNQRIDVMKSSGAFIRSWPAPQSDTLHSVHLLVLRDGRLLASDPSGGLVIYKVGEQSPTRLPLGGAGQAVGSVQPLGLALLPGNNILVTDGGGNRLLVVTVPAT